MGDAVTKGAKGASNTRDDMDIAKIKELIALMAQHDLTEVDIASGDQTIKLRRGQQPSTVVNHQPVIYAGGPMGGGMVPAPMMGAGMAGAPTMPAAAPAAAAPAPAPASAAAAGGGKPATDKAIESPMVGTCYLAPNPDAGPFVKVGQQVSADTVVCLIEAMKVFNEIKAEKSGVIESVLVKNGQAVEFGQALFAIR